METESLSATETNQPIRVLLADDHAVVRAGIRQFLEQADDITVIAEADDGDMARSLIAHHKPDVAVLDIQMPKATGIEVTRWVRANHALPATFYTGDALGSFNAWMRLLSGLLFGIGIVWFAYPRLHATFNEAADQIALKFQRAAIRATEESYGN